MLKFGTLVGIYRY